MQPPCHPCSAEVELEHGMLVPEVCGLPLRVRDQGVCILFLCTNHMQLSGFWQVASVAPRPSIGDPSAPAAASAGIAPSPEAGKGRGTAAPTNGTMTLKTMGRSSWHPS